MREIRLERISFILFGKNPPKRPNGARWSLQPMAPPPLLLREDFIHIF